MDSSSYLAAEKLYVGTISINDGIVDITDPCYSNDTWCARFGQKVKPGIYKCYVDIWNSPYHDSNPICKNMIRNDYRITSLTIFHKDYCDFDEGVDDDKFEILDTNIGVDAGLCGFYNHKPDFKEDKDWDKFWQNLSNLREYCGTCDTILGNGVTVSSGWGDGCYPLYKLEDNEGEIYALQLRFDEEVEE